MITRAANGRSFATALLVLLLALLSSNEVWAQAAPSPYTVATRYDDLGRVTGTITPDPDGAGSLPFLAVRNTYDASGRLIKVEQGQLVGWQDESVLPSQWPQFTITRTAEIAYDPLDRKLREWSYGPTGGTQTLTQYSYDAAGRLECTAVRMNAAVYASLPASACTQSTTGPQGQDRITRNIYDAAGQLLQVRRGVGGTDAAGASIESAEATYSYTPNGKRQYVIDAGGNRAEFRYDGHDRLEKWVLPSTTGPSAFSDATPASALASAGAVNEADYERYEYDPNGNRTKLRKRDGRELTYQYDGLNRMTVKVVPDGNGLTAAQTADVYYSYDLRGLQTAARFGSASGEGLLSQYDGFGRMQSSTLTLGGTARAFTYEHDQLGNRTRITHPDGVAFGYAYDPLGRFKQLTYWNAADGANGSVLQSLWYYPDGSLQSTGRVSVQANYSYDPIGRVSQYKLFHSVNGGSFNNLTRWWYGYNPASQLTSVTRSNDDFAWTGHQNTDRPYTANGLNQYTLAGPAAFCYDANGNLTADGSSVYRYDVENRLVEKRAQGSGNSNCTALSYSGALQASLSYDPMGRLYESTSGTTGLTTRYLYDGDALTLEYGASGTVLRRYVHGPAAGVDDPLFWFEGNAPAWTGQRQLVADHQGSIIATVLADGSILSINRYDEYGIPQSANTGRFQYTGQIWLPELGMYYYKARIYSPTLGRFLQVDPIGYEDQVNLYAYVDNDPVNQIDPTGTKKKPTPRDARLAKRLAERAIKKAVEQNAKRIAIRAALSAINYVPLALTLGLYGDTPKKKPQFVYRALNPTDLANITAGQGIVARSPGSSATIDDHVMGEASTRFISMTKDPSVAYGRYNSGYGVAVIDLSKLPSYEDVSLGSLRLSPEGNRRARRDSEVLGVDRIPQSAIFTILE